LSFTAYRRDEDFSGTVPHAAILSGVPAQWPDWHCDYVLGHIPVSLERGYVLCCPRQRKDHPALKAFREWILEVAACESQPDS